jgi:hypothetical protein
MKDYRSLEQKIRQVRLDEAEARNTAIRRKVENVGRPKDNVKDETSKLGKQGEIKTKIVDEDFKDENGDVKPKKIKDVDTDNDKQKISKTNPQNVDDPKEIKGGKTQVDLHPKTNDAPEDQEKEDKVSKKAANAANKEIGAKGVKEETMTGKLTLGSSQSQINAVVEAMKMMRGMCPKCGKSPCQCDGDPKKMKEELVGGQKKLDKNHNGKLDKQDFKMLRNKKMEEEAIDEVLDTPMKKLGYIAKNAYQVATADPAKMANDPKKANAIANRVIGAKRFQKKLNKEEVESLDEISLKTKINAYKATRDHDADYSYGSKVHDQGDRIHKNIVAKHGAKAGEHADRAAYGKPSTPASRSAEKAKPDVLKRDTTHPMRTTKSGVAHKQDQKSNAAVIKSRLGKHGKSNIPEEVEFSEAELARIEEIAKSL